MPYSPGSVLHVLAPARVGGLEQVVLTLAAGQARSGARVGLLVVLAPWQDRHPFLAAARSLQGVEILPLFTPARDYWGEVRLVADAVTRVKPEILHTHGYRPDVLAGLAARRQRVAQVSTAHGFTGGDWRNRFYEWLDVRAWRRCARVLAVSRPLERELIRRGVPPGQVRLLPNAWPSGAPRLDRGEARRRLGIGEGEVVLGWVGRLSPEKGPDLMIEALAALPGDRPRLVMIGAGAEGERLRSLAASRGVAERIQWAGEVEGAGALFPAFDCFVLSSRTEGTPIVLFEAMAAGTPIVAAAVGGVPDVITTTEGWLAPPGDAASLAGAIREALADPAARAARTGAAAERLRTTYSVENWVANHAAIYREAVAAPG
ncbi:MAG TPA: glycosyltransferase [Gemmatimonadales bacterium]|nr:glycosyltransferase [Gemmatimonadales bacterium]